MPCCIKINVARVALAKATGPEPTLRQIESFSCRSSAAQSSKTRPHFSESPLGDNAARASQHEWRLDLKLRDGPADDVYDAIKGEQPDCPIIIITGYPDSAMLDRILAKGPITVLKKPLKVEQLKETVRILGHQHAVKLAAQTSWPGRWLGRLAAAPGRLGSRLPKFYR